MRPAPHALYVGSWCGLRRGGVVGGWRLCLEPLCAACRLALLVRAFVELELASPRATSATIACSAIPRAQTSARRARGVRVRACARVVWGARVDCADAATGVWRTPTGDQDRYQVWTVCGDIPRREGRD